jgi:uncharacterized protein
VTIEFDPAKSARNAKQRGLPFERTADLDWDAAHTIEDRRRDYRETRYVALAPLTPGFTKVLREDGGETTIDSAPEGRLHVVCYCIRGEARRIISFRKANKREERIYAEEKAALDQRGRRGP